MPSMTAMKDPLAYLTPENIFIMIGMEPELRTRLLIRLLFRSGARVSEICGQSQADVNYSKKRGKFIEDPAQGVTIDDILWEENCIMIPWLKQRRKPGQPPNKRKVPLDRNTMEMIKEWLDYKQRHEIALDDPRIIPITRNAAYKAIRKAAERVGITSVGDPRNPTHPHCHTLRHSYVTHRVKATKGDYAKLRAVQLSVGHASITTTASYLDFDSKELHKEYDEAWEGVD